MKPHDTRALFATLVALVTVAASTLTLTPASARADTPLALPEPDPQAVMIDVSTNLFAAIDRNHSEISRDPTAVYPLVSRYLLPHFDAEYAAQLILAQHWRDATAEQRQRLIDALEHAILHTYAGALTDITADHLRVLPVRGDIDATQVTVRTEVTRSNGTVVKVDYRLRKTPDGWKAFDVVIEGISYVRNYRTDLGAEIAARGLNAVILRIESQGNLSAGNQGPGR